MSYDLRVYVKAERPRLNGDPFIVVGIPEYDSPTYNLRAMFVACMRWDYTQGDIYPVPQVIGNIERGIEELSRNEGEYLKYNAENGWGTTESALLSLRSLYDCIMEQAGDWGLDALYMSW